ncbi:TcmI family type II polyketide cyclase [Streptomyces sp. GESEQ-35]|uniref:TcmI family type II polyketide cyclase n=1 Tax=Streptomyces sp. GESEQ-35 TaxID=2812657 RepID=UPI001B32DC89|nr:TcmI family type II polyketide cyclase [Streptomyces sp. GESEQ-35]
MQTVVSLCRAEPDAITRICDSFAEFDDTGEARAAGFLRRQLFSYHDLLVQVTDADEVTIPGLGAPFDATATRFYRWDGKPADPGQPLHSTVIVNRMDPTVIPEVSALFAELDATDFPHHMGTRRRQLFSLDGVYFHLQDFTTSDGYALIDHAWKEADPRFIKICRELEPLVKVYDPASWRSTADQVATRVYRWEVPA